MYSNVIASFLFSAFAMTSVLARECVNKNVTETFPLASPSGVVITVERFASDHLPAVDVQQADTLERRQSSACTESNCDCSVPCLFHGCDAPAQPINTADCTALAETLENMSGTFTIPFSEGLGFFINSCEYVVTSSPTHTNQYCWHDMGVAVFGILSVCGAQQRACEGQNNAFFVDQISL